MPWGNLSDDAKSVITRPTESNVGGTDDKWASDSEHTEIRAQDVNRFLVAPARRFNVLSGANVAEGDDDILYKGVLAMTRERLTADRTYYVRADGSDANDGLANTAGRAFLTLQKAADVAELLDFNGHTVTIQVGAGTYSAGVSVTGPLIGTISSSSLKFVGDTTTPSNVVISATTACFNVDASAHIDIAGFKVTSTSNPPVQARLGTITISGNMDFGSASTGASHIQAGYFGRVIITASAYTISGGAGRHWSIIQDGVISNFNALTITLTGTPNFAVAFVQVAGAGVVSPLSGVLITFVGSATGKRYVIEESGNLRFPNAIIGESRETFFPGDQAGIATSNYFTPYSNWRNHLINPSGRVQDGVAGAIGDVGFGLHSSWYALTQFGNVTPTTISDVADGVPYMIRLTQNNAATQRFGYAQIIEGANCKHLRGRQLVVSGQARCSASVTLRVAVLEWTGTEDAATRDIVNSWTNGSFTLGGFFISTNFVASAGAISDSKVLTANTLTPYTHTQITLLGSTFNNLVVFIWASTLLAQNETLDFTVQLESGRSPSRHERRPLSLERMKCQRYEQRKTVQTENGARHIPLVKMRSTPIITASVGSAASVTPDGFELSHTAAASCDILADSRLGV
jgi:hypothetical protein